MHWRLIGLLEELVSLLYQKADAFLWNISKCSSIRWLNLARLILNMRQLLISLMRTQGEMLKDARPSHLFILNRHRICLEGIDPYISQILDLLQEADLLLEGLSNDNTYANRVILGIIYLQLALFIVNLEETGTILIKVLDCDTMLIAELLQNW